MIDALDECEPGDNNDSVHVVQTLINTILSFPSFKLFVTSCMERNIQKMFTSDDVGALKRLLQELLVLLLLGTPAGPCTECQLTASDGLKLRQLHTLSDLNQHRKQIRPQHDKLDALKRCSPREN
jgi:hypothetical protein